MHKCIEHSVPIQWRLFGHVPKGLDYLLPTLSSATGGFSSWKVLPAAPWALLSRERTLSSSCMQLAFSAVFSRKHYTAFIFSELKEHNAKYVVRVCEPTYDAELLENEEISVLDWPFRDGFPPPPRVIENWLKHVKTTFRESPESCIAVHCVAGLGRAPVLVALALIDLGMPSEDAVELIRRYRPGAMNSRQLKFLKEYESHSCLHVMGCTVM